VEVCPGLAPLAPGCAGARRGRQRAPRAGVVYDRHIREIRCMYQIACRWGRSCPVQTQKVKRAHGLALSLDPSKSASYDHCI